jgi:hypothetical protein
MLKKCRTAGKAMGKEGGRAKGQGKKRGTDGNEAPRERNQAKILTSISSD